MATATETFAVGAEQFTVAVEIDLNAVWLISGDFAGTIPAGEIGFINGNVNLTGDLIVEGLLTGIDTFTLTGNGFQLLAQDGGVLNLQGVQKSSWLRWGDTPVGWQIGDRLGVAPTAVGVYVPSEITWGGAWGTRPVNSSDVTLADGSIAKPEVANLSQTIVLQNLRRIHFHDGAGVASLKWLKVLNSGTTSVLADYPVHFHLNGEASRGSFVEGVVVEGGKNHAFVPHGSHGITFRDTVAYKTINHAYWWDAPFDNPANHSDDIRYEHALVLSADPDPDNPATVAGFHLGSGTGNACVESVAAGTRGGTNSAGFFWSETSNQPPNVWLFEDNVAHNNKRSGIRVWQNTGELHLISRFVGYRNGKAGIEHGAYRNHYRYAGAVLTGDTLALRSHALSNGPGLVFEDILTDGPLEITKHNQTSTIPVIYRNCAFTSVLMRETSDGGNNSGVHWFEDCGLLPGDFDMAGVIAETVIEVFQVGVLTHRWAGGWS